MTWALFLFTFYRCENWDKEELSNLLSVTQCFNVGATNAGGEITLAFICLKLPLEYISNDFKQQLEI